MTAHDNFANLCAMVDSFLELSVVIPCLNEVRTLGRCVQKALAFLEENAIRGEVVVADNGSSDGSIALALEAGARVVEVPVRGYGAALAGGLAAAKGRYVIMGDADDSYDFSSLMPFVNKLREGYDLVVGNRFQGEIKPKAMPFLNRYLGNPVLSFIGKLFFHIPLGDFHCGLRGFRREAMINLGLRTTGMEYASEMIVQAALHGLKLAEVPVILWPDGRGRPPHLSPWRDGWRHLRFLLLYSPRWLYLYPGLAMIVFGILVAALLLPGPVSLGGGVGLDVHTLLVGAMSFLVGVQSLTFGFLSRGYAVSHGILPRSPEKAETWLDGLMARVTLEKMLITAGGLMIAGFAAVIWAFHQWSAVGFGALDYQHAMRVLILALTALVGGLQLGFAAFLMGVMQIRLK